MSFFTKDHHPFVVVNPNSTNHRRVQREVIDVLADKGVKPTVFETPSPDFDDNVDAMREALETYEDHYEKLLVVGTAGDGTNAQIDTALILNELFKVSSTAPNLDD